ncbi:hypothetical protein [Vaccinia virus]|nr:hypothetical protein [Vaccinia virus]
MIQCITKLLNFIDTSNQNLMMTYPRSLSTANLAALFLASRLDFPSALSNTLPSMSTQA